MFGFQKIIINFSEQSIDYFVRLSEHVYTKYKKAPTVWRHGASYSIRSNRIMKQRTIQSQTTIPCNTEPKPSDYELNWREHFWAHLVDTLKMFAFLACGLVVWIFFSFFLASVWGG